MVKIEIIRSNILESGISSKSSNGVSHDEPSRRMQSNIETELGLLARACASSLIQARYRGYYQRTRHLMKDCNQSNNASHININGSGQDDDGDRTTGRSTMELNDSSCQTEEEEDCSSFSQGLRSLSTRRNAISAAYEECKQDFHSINLDGTEVLNILKAMGILGPREYDGLFKVASQNQYGGGSICHARYPIGITASIQDFETDLIKAWRDMNDKTNRSHIPMPKRRTRFCLNSEESKRARDSLQEMMQVPQEFLSFLADNPGVIVYNNGVQNSLLGMIGIVDGGTRTHGEELTIVDHLRFHSRAKSGSLHFARLEIAGQLVHRISQWEATPGAVLSSDHQIGDDECSKILRAQLCEANLLVSDLRGEVDRLQEQVGQLTRGHQSQEREKESQLPEVPLKAEAKNYPTPPTADSTRRTAKECKISSMASKPSPQMQGRTRREIVRPPKSSESKEIKYSKVNTVEIKFDGDEAKKRKPKSSSRGRPAPQPFAATKKKGSTPSNRAKKASRSHGDSHEDKISQLMKNSREKRHHGRKVAWKADDNNSIGRKEAARKKPVAKTVETGTPRSQEELFTRRMTSPSSSANEAFESSSSARFNAILERLRCNDS